MPDQKALSTQEVAAMLHVSCNTVYELIRRGEINSYRVGRKVRFTKEDVDQYIARSRHERSTPKVKTAELEGGAHHPRRLGPSFYYCRPGRGAGFAVQPHAAKECGGTAGVP